METKEFTIDAAGKTLGRVATDAAKALMGKKGADYVPHEKPTVKVTVLNASKLHIPEKKRRQKTYTHYSGYPGGLKKETLSALLERKGAEEAVRRAVKGMLPRNTHLTTRLKNLQIKN